MYAETPSRLVLAGELAEPEMDSLHAYLGQLAKTGQSALCLDMTSVTDCGRPALYGLLALTSGSAPIEVAVEGAHWNQFLVMLSEAPVVDTWQLCNSVRELVHRSDDGAGVPSSESKYGTRKPRRIARDRTQ